MKHRPTASRNSAICVCITLLFLLLLPLQPSAKGPAKLPSVEAAIQTALRPGDVIFQDSASFQSKALKQATGSRYTHCGIVLSRNGRLEVLEAVSPVRWTPIRKWIARGTQGHYVVMRLKENRAQLTEQQIAAMQAAAPGYVGKPYDLLFQWSDDEMYCSELVWKLYERAAGIRLVPLKTFRDYDLNYEEVQRHIKERFGYDIPYDEPVVAPSDLMESIFLEVVYSN